MNTDQADEIFLGILYKDRITNEEVDVIPVVVETVPEIRAIVRCWRLTPQSQRQM